MHVHGGAIGKLDGKNFYFCNNFAIIPCNILISDTLCANPEIRLMLLVSHLSRCYTLCRPVHCSVTSGARRDISGKTKSWPRRPASVVSVAVSVVTVTPYGDPSSQRQSSLCSRCSLIISPSPVSPVSAVQERGDVMTRPLTMPVMTRH